MSKKLGPLLGASVIWAGFYLVAGIRVESLASALTPVLSALVLLAAAVIAREILKGFQPLESLWLQVAACLGGGLLMRFAVLGLKTAIVGFEPTNLLLPFSGGARSLGEFGSFAAWVIMAPVALVVLVNLGSLLRRHRSDGQRNHVDVEPAHRADGQ